MKSRVHPQFRELLARLPETVQRRARAAFRRFKENPYHSSLQFKEVNSKRQVYSVRIGKSYRALGMMQENHEIVWFWIGTHAEYDKLIK
jgi:mRNA-degrading endonuclease RelE of RelBE toxin-antitoxin system